LEQLSSPPGRLTGKNPVQEVDSPVQEVDSPVQEVDSPVQEVDCLIMYKVQEKMYKISKARVSACVREREDLR
jgi:hypothetical protein